MNLPTALIAVRFALYVDLMLVFGLPLFALYTVQAGQAANGAFFSSRTVSGLSLSGAMLSILGLVLLAAAMNDVPLSQLDQETIRILMNGTAIGTAGKIRIAALLVAVPLALWPGESSRARSAVQSGMGAIALASLAWTGHGAADEGAGGLVHLTADIVHLLAAGVWVGALTDLVWLVWRTRVAGIDREDRVVLARRALAGFSTVGTSSVTLIIVTGLVNSWFLVGLENVSSLASSQYGRLLILKLVMFAGMVGLAGLNRFKLTPAIAARDEAPRSDAMCAIQRSVALEVSLGLTVLGLIAWLGTLAPPASH